MGRRDSLLVPLPQTPSFTEARSGFVDTAGSGLPATPIRGDLVGAEFWAVFRARRGFLRPRRVCPARAKPRRVQKPVQGVCCVLGVGSAALLASG